MLIPNPMQPFHPSLSHPFSLLNLPLYNSPHLPLHNTHTLSPLSLFLSQSDHRMNSACAEQHKFHPAHQLPSPNKSLSLRDIDIPPRKLLTRRAATHDGADMFSDSPRFSSSDETLLQKFLPYNNLVDSDDDSDDPYSSDHFRMYEFKVRRCTRSRSHDWTDCPFAHPGEKARRRDPRRYHYSGTVCPEFRRGGCSRGDGCEFSHGVFECWLHPARYRTEACKDGKNCKRKVCFFAHTPRQLRILPVNVNSHNSSSPEFSCNKAKFLNPSSLGSNINCCLFCHCTAAADATTTTNSSPTSTLFGMSQFSPPLSPSSPVSPPLSPVKPRSANGFSPISRYSDRFGGSEVSSGLNHHAVVSYDDVLIELICSLEGLNFNEAASPVSAATRASNLPWLDVSFNCGDQQQFTLSPTISGSASFSNGKCSGSKFFRNESKVVNDVNGPDLGWVNELLM